MKIEALFGLDRRVALVTGASRGIGAAIAKGLAEAGADIIAVGRSAENLESICEIVRKTGSRAWAFETDVSQPDDIDVFFPKLDSLNLAPDILINNAGIEQVCPSSSIEPDLWDRILDTNLKGAFFIAQGFARPLLEAGKPGSIINLGSLTSSVGVPTAVPYTASKSGILGMTRALSSEWSPHGIRVNALGPGYFRTQLTETFYRDEDWQQRMLARIPMGRFGKLGDLVGAAIFLASPASSYLTGQIINIDGGYLASI